MKGLLICALAWVLAGTTALAEERYVSEIVSITLRTGKGTDHKIVAMIASGQTVELLEPGKDWSRVRTTEGREGYVLSRLLTTETPNGLKLRELTAKHEALLAQAASPMREITRLRKENEALKAELADRQQQMTTLSTQSRDLQARAADFDRARAEAGRTAALLAARSRMVEACEKELAALRMNHNIWWFLAGTGVLTLGFVIGFSSRRQRRRSSLL